MHKGLTQATPAHSLVADYLARKSLAQLGYQFNGNDLSDLDFKVYSLIDSELIRLENEEMKRDTRSKN